MVYDYLISLKRPDYKVVDLISQLLYLIAVSTFVYFATKAAVIINIYLVAALIIVACFIFVKRRSKKKGLAYYTPGLAIATITWVVGPYGNWLMFALYAACTLLEREMKFHKEIGFTENEVVFNTLIKKHYEWSDFKNVLIKDGILTLDFTNNKIVQREIEGEVTAGIEKEFNDFCRARVSGLESRVAGL